MIYQNIVTGIMLVICTLEDIRNRRICSRSLVVYCLLVWAGKPVDAAAGAIPGVFSLLLSVLSRQSLGYGDSMIILICGISLGMEQGFLLIYSAFLMAGIWSVIILSRGKKKGREELPFLPFLLAGWIVSITAGCGKE